MGRRKIIRTAEEEANIKRLRCEKEKERHRNKRIIKKTNSSNQSSHIISPLHNLSKHYSVINNNSEHVTTTSPNNTTSYHINNTTSLDSASYDVVNNIINVPSTSSNASLFRYPKNDNPVFNHMHHVPSQLESCITETISTSNVHFNLSSDHDYCSTIHESSSTSISTSFLVSAESEQRHSENNHDSPPCNESTKFRYFQFDHNYSQPGEEFHEETFTNDNNLNQNQPLDQRNENNLLTTNNSNEIQENYIGNMSVKCCHYSSEAAEYRSERNVDCNVDLLKEIDLTLREHNVFAKSYQMMKDVLKENSIIDLEGNTVEPELNLLFTLKPGMDARRYNFQRVNEVAAVFLTTADGEIPESYVTIQNKTTKSLQFLSTMDPNTDPWVYPLFYPYGEQGWHASISYKNKTNRRVTRADYYKYKLAIRDNFNVFLMGRRLSQQWIVDSYVKIERDRLNYCKFNQKKLRAESYQGLIDHLQLRNSNNNTSSNIGKIIVLPSSFTGSLRNMMQHYQDAMSIVRTFGKPDLFVTMTCNPKWREITENLLPGQSASDRPDLVARVFNIKKDALINMIVKQSILGTVIAYNWVIEFQKRGLPHLHMLIILMNGSKIKTCEQVDKLISAEIPDSVNNPILYDIVTKNMLHGPCGDWCLINGVCSKKFPKNFRNETNMDENGYPHYRREDKGITITRNNHVFDNRHVVPYNPTLLQTFNCHINVEIVSSVRAVKYLYKYVFKGHDKAAITINGTLPNTTGETNVNDHHPSRNGNDSNINDHNEIRNFVDARYVGPVEAVWRIVSKNLQDKSHSITRLPVHLPNQHSITINDDCDDIELQEALQKQSMLIDYFKLNVHDPNAWQYTYSDIPLHYVFKKDNNSKISCWQPRKRQFNVIGLMYSISPTQIELFHLRLLLIHIKGATSFENLRTVNGVIYDTFTTACLAAGLIEDDQEWRRTLLEAVIWMMPRQLRCLFVRILIHCQPLQPNELWNEFKEAMSEDYSRNLGIEKGEKKAYIYINSMLNREGYSLSAFPDMPQINEIDIEIINQELLQNHSQGSSQSYYNQLNIQQKEVVDHVMTLINDESLNTYPNCIYIDGPGGSGKTFIYKTLCHILKDQNKNVCTMAYTGIAATLLPNGKTVHKTFGLPVPMFSDSSSHIKPNSKQGQYLKETNVFIWDEAPMAPRYALEIIDRTLQHIMNNNIPFGGKLMILGGDFRQLLPVQPNATRSEIINLSIKFSFLWKHFRIFSLTQNMRALPEEIEFVKFLLNIGDGSLNDANDEINLPDTCYTSNDENIVENIYGRIIRGKRYDELSTVVILSARNIDVDVINKKVIELLDISTEKIYSAIDSTENCDVGNMDDAILPEYLNTLNPPNFPPYELQLRKYSIVMLIRNLNLSEGLCNGTRLIILELGNNILKCKILSGDKFGDIVFINRVT
ncbi:uncharacterized protein LOC123266031 [Cotesia glomerata]|uniref:uncharacterized protein LOC123266031 n=1 Tax=Cotesia glomerata TaxID=32391 RepID=UPI001D01F03A|nr:uncharacterized protein LOC123266031 [Cotesia glomerata]